MPPAAITKLARVFPLKKARAITAKSAAALKPLDTLNVRAILLLWLLAVMPNAENAITALPDASTATARETEEEWLKRASTPLEHLNHAALYSLDERVRTKYDLEWRSSSPFYDYVVGISPDNEIEGLEFYGRDVMQALGLGEPLDAVNKAINATKDEVRKHVYIGWIMAMKAIGHNSARDWMELFGEIYRDNIRAAYNEGLAAGGEEEAVSNGDLLADQFASARRLGRAVTEKKEREAREAEKKAREEEEARLRSEEEYKKEKLNNTILTVSLSVIGVIVGAYPLFLLCKASHKWNYEQWAAALAVVLLVLAVADSANFPRWLDLPYGFYLLLRVIVAVLSAWQAARALMEKRHPLLFLLPACLCLIYQPLVKIPFERENWLWLNAASVFVLIIGARRKKDNVENDA